MKIRALVVDDMALARKRVKECLALDPEIEIVGESENGQQAIRAIRELAPDLVFLDVQMPKISGFDVVEAIGAEQMPTVIFVTAYDEFALRAFDVNAIGYLLKPFEEDRFIRVLEIAKHQIKGNLHKGSDDRLYQLIKEVKNEPKYVKRLAVKLGESSNILLTDEIDWINTAGNYVELHIGRNKYLYREQMNQLEQKLDPDKFVRVHRSTIVNIERIKTLHPLFNKDYLIILKDRTELNLSRTYHKRLSSLLAGL